MSDPMSDAQYWYLEHGPQTSDLALATYWDDYHRKHGHGRGPETIDDIIDRPNRGKKE